jgi:hypothetical protein
MEYIPGNTLFWKCLEPNFSRENHLKVINQVAKLLVLAQLYTPHFPNIGSLFQNTSGDFYIAESVDRRSAFYGPFVSAREYLTHCAQLSFQAALRQWQTTFIEGVDLDRVGTDWDTIHPNIKDILLGWGDLAAASSLGIEENQNYFPLMHGDLSPGNIILSDDYDVLGIIDWSWSSTVPSQLFGTPFSGALNFIRQTPEHMAEDANYFLRCCKTICKH